MNDRIQPLADQAPEAGNETPDDELADARLWTETWDKE